MSEENKLVPELRFPEFSSAENWIEETVSQVYEFKITNSFSRENLNYEKGNVKNIHYGDIHTKFNTLFDIQKEKVPYINEEIAISKIKEDNYCQQGDIIFADASEDINDIGKSIEIVNLNNEKLVSGLHTLLARQRENKLIIGFGGHLFKSDSIRRQIQREAQGSKVLGISSNRISSIKISYPYNPKEQQKIASCLSLLDEVIAAHSQKLELLKEHKKSLMQNLFPQEGETVPKYRFPEFGNDGEWEEKKLDEVCKFIRGPFGGALKKEIFVKEGYAVYEQSHAIYNEFSSFRYYITEEKFNELKRFAIFPSDIIMSCSGTMGKFAIIPEGAKNGVINQALLKLTLKEGYDTNFVKDILELPSTQNKLLSQSAGGAIKNVAEVSQIKEISLSIPNIKEQQKIAYCLSSLDKIIISQTDKVEQLKLHKKGLIQSLFPKNE